MIVIMIIAKERINKAKQKNQQKKKMYLINLKNLIKMKAQKRV